MKNHLGKFVTTFSASLLLFTAVPTSFVWATETTPAASTAADSTLADGTYTVNFQLLNPDTSSPSSLASYLDTAATITVKNGVYQVAMTVVADRVASVNSMNVQFWTYDNDQKVLANGSGDPSQVQFQLTSLEQSLLNVTYQAGTYSGNHDTQLVFDLDSLTKISGSEETTPEEPETLADGTYHIKFSLLQENSQEVSSLGKYLTSPATLTVTNGKYVITMAVPESQASAVSSMKVQFWTYDSAGNKILASDINDTSKVSFEITDLEDMILNVTYAAGNYQGNHDTRLVFDAASLTAVAQPEPETPAEPETPEEPETTPEENPEEDNDANEAETTPEENSYQIAFQALEEHSEKTSMAASYLNPTAEVVEKNDQYQVTFTIKDDQASDAKDYNLLFWGFNADGSKYQATTSDETKIVYTVDTLDELLANVTYSVPNVIEGDHNFRFVFEAGEDEEPDEAEGIATLTDKATGVTVTNLADHLFPAGTTLSVTATTSGTAFDNVSSLVNQDFSLYQIHLLDADGFEYQPENEIQIKLPLPTSFASASTYAYYYDEAANQLEKLNSTVSDNYFSFNTDHLSYYGLAVNTLTNPHLTNLGTASTGKASAATNPKTSDTSKLTWYLLSFITSGLGLAYLGFKKFH